MTIKDLHGKISRCNRCTNWDKERPMGCTLCFSRGYVAECLQCSGAGQITEGVAGTGNLNDGKMRVTCPGCGGTKCFAVNKPENFVEPEDVKKSAEELALDTPPAAGDHVPPPNPRMHIANTPIGDSISSVLA